MSGTGRIATAAAFVLAGALLALPTAGLAAEAQIFRLANGFELAVIEDRRAPIVTHFIGYRTGGAGDPPGKSGVAHFVEHLMFKSAAGLPGSYAGSVVRLGGNSNAVTTHDATLYHARVPNQGLRLVMQREADRMTGLRITDGDVSSERDVILAERRSRIDGRPSARLVERVDMALNAATPYHRPSIGLAAEIAAIGRADADAFYRRHYAPGNAFAVVTGDVTVAEVRAIAEATYGAIPGDGPRLAVASNSDTAASVARDSVGGVVVRDPRINTSTLYRAYRVPSYATAAPGEAEALELLAVILSSGKSSRMSKWLDAPEPRIVAVDGGYLGARRHGGQLSLLAVVERERDVDDVARMLDATMRDIAEFGVSDDELARARDVLDAHRIITEDDQFTRTQIYAERWAAGLAVDRIESSSASLAAVGSHDVQAVARQYLISSNAVSGRLLPAKAFPPPTGATGMAMEPTHD